MTASVQVFVDLGGSDGIPHTFISVTQPDGTTVEYGLVPYESGSPSGPGRIDITGVDSPSGQSHEWSVSAPSVQLSNDQYKRLMDKINDSINNPPDYTFPGQWWPGDGNNCTGWVKDIWNEADLPATNGVSDPSTWNPWGQAIKLKVKDWWDNAKDFIRRRDPLTFDLDNDGLETVGASTTNPILFDHDGDGTKNGTGWVASDDAMLVLDRNGNGTIDNGRELFGDNTIKSNGQTATDGFDALADLDSNADGKVDTSDSSFNNLRIWRDLNQDGISQQEELFTLASQNIIGINVAKTANSQTLANGNQVADLGTFIKSDGTQGVVGEATGNVADVNLAQDTFHRQFADQLDTTAVASLPDRQACPELGRRGSGAVRDLSEAVNDVEWRVAA